MSPTKGEMRQDTSDMRSVPEGSEQRAAGKRRRLSNSGSDHGGANHEDGTVGGSALHARLVRLERSLEQLNKVAGINRAVERVEGDQLDGAVTSNSLGRHGDPDTGDPAQRRLRHTEHLHRRPSYTQRNNAPDLDSISDQLEMLTDLLRTQHSNGSHRATQDVHKFQQNMLSPRLLPLNSGVPLTIPSEQQRNVLFRCWLSSVYPILPIVEPSITLMHYRTFHFWYTHGLENGTSNPVEEYVPLFYAIYYAGVVSLSTRGFQKWFPESKRMDVLRSLMVQFVSTLSVPADQLQHPLVLAARVMMFHMCKLENSNIVLASTNSQLIKSAHSLNLHREKPNESYEREIAELRRRLWWEVVNVDTMEASASNTPPSINHHFSDTPMITEIKDHKLDTPEARSYESELEKGSLPVAADDLTTINRPSMVSVLNLVMKARTILASNARTILNINLSARPKTRDNMVEIRKSIEEVDNYINAMIKRIPSRGLPEMDFVPNRAKSGQSVGLDHANINGEDLISNEVEMMCGIFRPEETWIMPYTSQHRHAIFAFHKWARVALSMSVDQLHCFSYAPFLHNSRRKVWLSARQCALRHAHSNLRKYNALATDIELERYRWAWSSLFQPIHACLIILLDAYEHPKSREAPRSRALIDEMISLAGSAHGIIGGEYGLSTKRPLSESGDEAMAMLILLRTKAWRKAGLDPCLLWTEQDQIDVGIATPLSDDEKMAQSFREDTIYHRQANPEHNYFRSAVEQRAREHFHPSEIATVDDIEQTPLPSNPIAHIPQSPSPSSLSTPSSLPLRRAHANQARVDVHYLPTTKIHSQASSYTFRPPSDLYDVGELIRRIRNFQPTPIDSSHPTSPSNIQHSNPLAATAPQPRSNDVQTPQRPKQTSDQAATVTTNPETNLNMEIDWAKWDEIFGHIMDDGADVDFMLNNDGDTLG